MAQPAQGARIVLRPTWLIDGITDDAVGGLEVVVDGELIVAVRPVGVDESGRPEQPGDGRLMDLPGATLLPGLIDAHVHYTIDASNPDGIAQGALDPPERAVLIGAGNARRALLSGVTTARSAGASRSLDVALAAAIERGDVPGPRLLAAGTAITITGGHGEPFGRMADSELEMIRAVRALARDGAAVIKVVASEAAMLTSGRAGVQELSEAELTAITREAGRLQLSVLAHAQNSAAVVAAARAGVDSIEHAFLADDAALEAIRASGAFLTPTLTVTDVYATLPGLDPIRRRRQAEISIAHRRSCQAAIALGLPLVTGTDCGVPGVHSDLLAREIALLHDHGLTPMQAIQAATVNGARLLRRQDEVGTLAPGKRADIIAVAGNPIADLATLGRPVLVLKGGQTVSASGGH